MKYVVSGPYKIQRKFAQKDVKSLDFSNRAMNHFWETANDDSKLKFNISSALGCYIYALDLSGKITPWYVGKTNRGFRGDAFKKSNQSMYQWRDFERGLARPVMFFIIAVTSSNKARKSVDKDELDWVEKVLNLKAFKKNTLLKDIYSSKYIKYVSIPGIYNAGFDENTVRGEFEDPAEELVRSFRGLKTLSALNTRKKLKMKPLYE